MICSKTFKDFYLNLFETIYTPSLFVARLFEEFDPVARELKIGKLRVDVDIEGSVYSEKGLVIHKDMYVSDAGFEEEPISTDFSTKVNEQVAITVYPVKNCIWTKDEIEDIKFMNAEVFVLVSRSRLFEMVINAEETDVLTGSKNPTALKRVGGQLMAQGKLTEYNGIFINLRDFKTVNAKYGSKIGDEAIIFFTKVMRDYIGERNYFFRMGGDNFFILSRKEKVNDILDFASRIVYTMNLDGQKKELKIRYRAGVGEGTKDSIYVDLLNKAANNLAIAKKKKKDVVYGSQKQADNQGKFGAPVATNPFANDYVVCYQPIVELETNSICAAEAIVVKKEGLHAKVTPNLIVHPGQVVKEIEFFVFEQVCHTIKIWIERGVEPVPVAVKFSKIHLADINFENRLCSIVAANRIAAKYIEIRLIEDNENKFLERSYAFMERMHKKGFRISVSDVGTIYSSLAFSKTKVIDTLRLRKQIVELIKENDVLKNDEIVIKSVVAMSKELGIQVIGEEVEKQSQVRYLNKTACTMAFGEIFEPPLILENFTLRLIKKQTYIY